MANKENDTKNNTFPYQTLFDKYKVSSKIGKGSFGTVFSGVNITSQEPVAIKTEVKGAKNQSCLLESEAYRLVSLKGFKGIPKVYQYGKVKGYNILVMELLGKSLNELFNQMNRRFSLQTVCILANDMIRLIEYVHEHSVLHRDIKPDNFMMGRGDKEDILYLIDFGLAKKYINNGIHIQMKTGKSITGTARYCSVYTHQGLEQSRRDDLESIGYVLMYFLRGNLPWQGVKVKEGEKHYEKIGNVKMNTSVDELCEGFPEEIKYYFNYVKQLEFEEEPNYNFLLELFEGVLIKYCKGIKLAKITMKNKGQLLDWKNGNRNSTSNTKQQKNKSYKRGFSLSKQKSMFNNGRTSMMSSHLSRYASNNNTNNNMNYSNTNNNIYLKKGTDDSSNKKSNILFRKTYGKQRTFSNNPNVVSNLMLTKDTKETKDDTKNISDGEKEENENNMKSKEKDKNNNTKSKSKSPNNKQDKIHCQCFIF